MKKLILCSAAAFISTVLAAAVEISVSSQPALPAENLIKNPSFEAEKIFPWRSSKEAKATLADEKIAGSKAIKITGDPQKSPNIWQSLAPTHIKAGDPLYARVSAKNVDCNPEKRSATMAWQAFLTNGKRPYMPAITFPKEDYDWAVFENVIKAPGDIRNITFYLCYYKQEGAQYFDDVYVQGGWTDLNISVKGENLASVKVRHSVTGTVLSEKIVKNAFNKTIKVPYFGSYTVEVTDKNGVQTSKLYPENVDTNRSGENILQLTPGRRVALHTAGTETLSFTLPESAKGKKVFLEFSARCHQTSPVAGYTGMLKVAVNGKVCRAPELVKPKNRIQTASGGEMLLTRNNGYVLYYSNACYNISEDCSYSPVNLPDRNPFNFKLDVTKMIKPGLNKVSLSNTLAARYKKTIYVDNLVLVTE